MRCIRNTSTRLLAYTLAVLVLPAGILPSASAADLSEEPFNYSSTSGPILGQNGGSGWSGAWVAGGFNASIFDNQMVAAGSLNFNPLSVSGNRTSTGANNAITGVLRSFAAAGQVGQNDTITRYLSFEIRPEGALNDGVFNGFFGVYLDGVNDDLFVGKPGAGTLTNYVLEERGGGFQSSSAQTTNLNETTFLVVRADFSPGLDSFRLYTNPTPGLPEPIIPAAVENALDLGAVTGIVLYSTGAHSIDEIRWGETYADVTPATVPEPSTLVLAGLALLGLLGAGSRFRRI